MSYTQPIYQTISLVAATISAAATLFTAVGPRGYTGRLVSIAARVTTTTTTTATLLTVGTAGDGDAFGTLNVPVVAASASAIYNNPTLVTPDDALMAANTAVVIATDGGCDAGAADITVVIAWFK